MEPGSLGNGLSANYDVVIVGAGLAGLTLARQLLLQTDKTILLVDKKSDLPGRSQKVGESLVQLSGYYLSKVLDLEEHLFVNHYLKYNLRFQWKTADRQNQNLEDYSASFIRLGSNIATFQLDRNVLEAHLFEINRSDPRLNFTGGVRDLKVQFSETGDDHEISVGGKTVRCRWVVDASGRGAVLKRTLSLEAANPIRHGATWCWVDGLVNVEKLTNRSPRQVRIDRRRHKHRDPGEQNRTGDAPPDRSRSGTPDVTSQSVLNHEVPHQHPVISTGARSSRPATVGHSIRRPTAKNRPVGSTWGD